MVWVNVKKALGLSKQDRNGSSDAYITIAFSKYGKPMYSTRVVIDDLNPIWNESTAILIRSEHIKAGESLSIELWDSDRFTSDDLVGKCRVPLQDLMVDTGKIHNHVCGKPRLANTPFGEIATACAGPYWTSSG